MVHALMGLLGLLLLPGMRQTNLSLLNFRIHGLRSWRLFADLLPFHGTCLPVAVFSRRGASLYCIRVKYNHLRIRLVRCLLRAA